ncbi:MAG: hypothetical protein ABIQ31_18340 [Ferruginibacter sp.]
MNRIFKYKNYTAGKVVFEGNQAIECKMNYNQLSGKMLFINPADDTLEFITPDVFDIVIVGKDSFYFNDGIYLEQVTHYPANNLFVNQTVKFIGKEKKGAYGTYSSVAAISSSSTFTNDSQITAFLGVDENAVFTYRNTYLIADKTDDFLIANKKNFLKVFPVHEKEIKNYLDQQHMNFNKKGDLEKLLKYAQSLN